MYSLHFDGGGIPVDLKRRGALHQPSKPAALRRGGNCEIAHGPFASLNTGERVDASNAKVVGKVEQPRLADLHSQAASGRAGGRLAFNRREDGFDLGTLAVWVFPEKLGTSGCEWRHL